MGTLIGNDSEEEPGREMQRPEAVENQERKKRGECVVKPDIRDPGGDSLKRGKVQVTALQESERKAEVTPRPKPGKRNSS